MRGTRPRQDSSAACRAVHPRACGELHFTGWTGKRVYGSSPRMRGTRTIPLSPKTFAPVHPRACGELLSRPSATTVMIGSSPRMRGTHPIHSPHQAGGRFIPAHAGNSLIADDYGTATTVHPRACGELVTRKQKTSPTIGSSPRMRGTLFLENHDSKRFVRG